LQVILIIMQRGAVMIVRMLGARPLARLMEPPADLQALGADCAWLMHGPTDKAVVEPPSDAVRRRPSVR
jgi:hypothetical protein